MIHIQRIVKLLVLLTYFVYLGESWASNNSEILKQLKDRAVLTQSWELAQNYRYGFTVDEDPYKALAWQYVYVTLLPRSYPGSYGLLNPFKVKLPKSSYDEAYQFSKELKVKYQLPTRMDEKQLQTVFQAKESELTKTHSNPNMYHTIEAFFEAVELVEPKLAEKYRKQWDQYDESRSKKWFVFGQVLINGSVLESTVVRNQELQVDRHGFFIGEVDTPLYLTSKGYDGFYQQLDLSKRVLSLGQIVLNKLPESQQSSVVGDLRPIAKLNEVGMVVIFKGQYIDPDNPWNTALIPVTKLSNGQFYVKGLGPGEYQLIISSEKQKKKVLFKIASAGVKTIKTIQIN